MMKYYQTLATCKLIIPVIYTIDTSEVPTVVVQRACCGWKVHNF